MTLENESKPQSIISPIQWKLEDNNVNIQVVVGSGTSKFLYSMKVLEFL